MRYFILMLCLLLSVAEGAKTYKTNEVKRVHAKGLKKKAHQKNWTHQSFSHLEITIPNTMDLRAKLTPIRNQGSCGSCWMHSVTAVHRDGHFINTGKDIALSEQDMDCVTTESGCNGGYFDAFDFIMKGGKGLQGQHSGEQVPYVGRDGRCQTNVPVVAHITAWHMIGNSQGPSPKDIEAVIVKTGKPVSITVAAGAGDFESYNGGVYNGCVSAGTDHMTNIVGWDNENATFDANGYLPPGHGFWIMRNSWGTGWGENGYMRIRMTDNRGHKCNSIAEEAAYAEFDDDPIPVPPTPVPPVPPVPPAPEMHWWWLLLAVLGGAGIMLVLSLLFRK